MDEEQRAIKDCQLGNTESYRLLVEKYKAGLFMRHYCLRVTEKMRWIYRRRHFFGPSGQ